MAAAVQVNSKYSSLDKSSLYPPHGFYRPPHDDVGMNLLFHACLSHKSEPCGQTIVSSSNITPRCRASSSIANLNDGYQTSFVPHNNLQVLMLNEEGEVREENFNHHANSQCFEKASDDNTNNICGMLRVSAGFAKENTNIGEMLALLNGEWKSIEDLKSNHAFSKDFVNNLKLLSKSVSSSSSQTLIKNVVTNLQTCRHFMNFLKVRYYFESSILSTVAKNSTEALVYKNYCLKIIPFILTILTRVIAAIVVDESDDTDSCNNGEYESKRTRRAVNGCYLMESFASKHSFKVPNISEITLIVSSTIISIVDFCTKHSILIDLICGHDFVMFLVDYMILQRNNDVIRASSVDLMNRLVCHNNFNALKIVADCDFDQFFDLILSFIITNEFDYNKTVSQIILKHLKMCLITRKNKGIDDYLPRIESFIHAKISSLCTNVHKIMNDSLTSSSKNHSYLMKQVFRTNNLFKEVIIFMLDICHLLEDVVIYLEGESVFETIFQVLFMYAKYVQSLLQMIPHQQQTLLKNDFLIFECNFIMFQSFKEYGRISIY